MSQSGSILIFGPLEQLYHCVPAGLRSTELSSEVQLENQTTS